MSDLIEQGLTIEQLYEKYNARLAENERLRAELMTEVGKKVARQETIEQQAQRIASLEGALEKLDKEVPMDCINARAIIGEALAKEQDDPDHEPENSMCACPTCIAKGWEDQV